VFGVMFSSLHFFMFSLPSREHSLEFQLQQLRDSMHGQVHGLRLVIRYGKLPSVG
jgi:hypothetical protein